MAGKKGAWEPASVHLDALGEARTIEVRVRTGSARLRDLLPPATEISRQVTGLALAQAAARGEAVSCVKGCAACCRHLVPISAIEARHLAEVVDALPPKPQARVRRRFAAAVGRMEQLGLLDPDAPRGRHALRGAGWDDVSRRYFAAGIACPLLEGEACGVYADRPLICREYHVVTPAAWCDELSPRVRAIERPAHMSEALATAGNAITGEVFPSVPLPLALEWVEVHGGAYAGVYDGAAMFHALAEAVGSDD